LAAANDGQRACPPEIKMLTILLTAALTALGAQCAVELNEFRERHPASEMPIMLFLIALLATLILARI
jgi:hypothetical protein